MAGPESVPPDLSPDFLAQNIGGSLLGTCIAFLFLDTFFIILLYASRMVAKEKQASMYMTSLMTIAYFTCCIKITLGILAVEAGGAGRHMAALPQSKRMNMLKIQTALQIVCPTTTSFTKLGILCLLHQILGRTSKNIRFAVKAMFIFIVLLIIAQIIIPFANCRPFSKTWNPMGPGSCAVSSLFLWRYVSIPNVVTTLVMICIPLPAMYKLRVTAPTKIGLGIVFAVCVVGVVAAIMRFQSFQEVQNFDDITFESIKPLCWTVAESGIYLIAGVLPTLRPLMRRVFGEGTFDRLLSRSLGKSSGSWGNKRASRLVAVRVGRGAGKPLPPLPLSSEMGTIVVELSKSCASRYSLGSEPDSILGEEAKISGRV